MKVKLKPMSEAPLLADILIYTSPKNCFIGAVSGPHDAEDFEGNWFCVEVKSADGDYTPYDDNSYNGKEVWGTLLVGLSCRRWRNESRTRK